MANDCSAMMWIATAILTLTLNVGICRGECIAHEREALLHFKSGLTDRVGRLDSWNGSDCCTWMGLQCSQSNGHVVKLDLHNPNSYDDYDELWALNGTIDNSLFSLRYLGYLDLSWNDFNGIPIPSQIRRLQGLRYLKMSGAGIGGDLPQLESLSSLEHLDLSDNWRLGGVIPSELGNLSRLKHLDLYSCNFSGVIPSEVGTLFALQYLDLSYASDRLEMHSLSWLGNLTVLTHLSLDYVNMSMVGKDWDEAFHRNSRLQYLSMADSSFPGLSIPSSLLNLTSLLHLDISANGLSSMSVISQAQWPHLTYLDLGSNQIEGVIPHSIGNLTKLALLNLDGNTLNASIPPSLGRLFFLTYLDLSGNQLSGSIPPSLSNLSSLTRLSLSDNQLSGSIPQSFRQLSSLRYLELSSNNITGHVSFALFQNLTALTWVDLSHNNLTFNTTFLSPPAFQLEFLRLASCNIQGDFPAVISTQFKLADLDLSRNRIAGNIPTWLWQLPTLGRVNISFNLLTGGLPPTLNTPSIIDLSYNYMEGPLPTSFPNGFDQLYLSHNLFNGSIPSQIGKYTQQSFFNPSDEFILDLSNNHLSGGIPSSICGNGNVQIIDLSGNKLAGIVDPNLWNCSGLVKLNLAHNKLNGQIPEQLGRLRQLQTLRMNGNNLSGPLPSSLQSCESLEIMDLSHNNLNGTIPRWIYHLSKLRVLVLKANVFKGSIPSEITRLHHLQVLDLSYNYLTGELPANFTNFHAMKCRSLDTYHSFSNTSVSFAFDGVAYGFSQALNIHEDETDLTNKAQEMHYVEELLYQVIGIDLSSNYLSGNIPEEMGLLQGLMILNMSRNQFKGEIPRILENISELESLDLSRNQLTGAIPMELQALTFLEYLDVSHNRLTGRIPEENQWSTFNASSFEANQDLCGRQLNKSCENKNHLNGTNNDEEMDEQSEFEIPWWNVGVGLSFAFGFGGFFFVIGINRRWRRNYFKVVDRYAIVLLETMGIL